MPRTGDGAWPRSQGIGRGRGEGAALPTALGQNLEMLANSKSQPGLSGHYESTFVLEGDPACFI